MPSSYKRRFGTEQGTSSCVFSNLLIPVPVVPAGSHIQMLFAMVQGKVLIAYITQAVTLYAPEHASISIVTGDVA